MSAATITYASVLSGLEEGPDNKIIMSQEGVSSAVLSFYAPWDRAVALVAAVRTHPTYPWLIRDGDADISKEPGGHALITINYKGVDPDGAADSSGSGGENSDGEIVTFSLSSSASTEPIETHPQFSDFAGTRANPQNFATFEPDGLFHGFKSDPDSVVPTRKCGVRSYMVPGLIYRRTRVIPKANKNKFPVSTKNLMKIDEPPSSPLLPATEGENRWLKVELNAEAVGEGLRVTEGWQLSGERGWDEDIYGA